MPKQIDVPGMGIVEFPDSMDDDQISAAIKSNMPAEKALPVDPLMDVVKGAGIGAVKGTIGLADLPELAARGLNTFQDYGRGRLGLRDSFAARFDPQEGRITGHDLMKLLPLGGRIARAIPDAQRGEWGQAPQPPSAAIQGAIEKQTGPFYEPQTYAGQWADTIGGFAPAAVGGPGSLTSRLVTQAAIPAVASEGAGYLTKGTKFETPSKVAAALIAGPLASRAALGRAAPSAEQLKAAYRDVVNDPVMTATPVNTAGMSGRIKSTLQGEGFDPLNSPRAFNRAEHIDTYSSPTAGDIIAVRKKLRADSSGIPSSETVAAGLAKREVDKEIATISPEFRDANRNYAAAKRSDLVTEKAQIAEDRARAANSGQNSSNATRQRIVDILANPKLRQGWSEAEIAQARKIAHGTAVGNTGRYIGNLLGGGGGLGQLVTAAALGGGGYAAGGETGGAAGLALALAGRGGKSIERASTKRQVNILDEMIRSRAPLAAGAPRIQPLTVDDLIKALTAAQSTRPVENR